MDRQMFYLKLLIVVGIILNQSVDARKHKLIIVNDSRQYFSISTFGFYQNGRMEVSVDKLKVKPQFPTKKIGFSLEKTTSTNTEKRPEDCPLEKFQPNDTIQHVFFIFDFKNKQIGLKCSEDMKHLHIVERQETKGRTKLSDSHIFNKQTRDVSRSKRQTDGSNEATGGELPTSTSSPVNTGNSDDIFYPKCEDVKINMTYSQTTGYYRFMFVVYVSKEKEVGLYNLNFHNCMNYDAKYANSTVDLTIEIEEMNPHNNYLSAGEMPLPALHFMMSLLFFLSACFWFFLLKKSKDPVFKIHYLMGVLVVIKSFSLFFHGVNYHFIETEGHHMEAWAVMYYIMHLLKGALLFTILALIGSGWAFIKHVLSSKERKIFLIIIPMQIIANVATIIVDETEEGSQEHTTWVELLTVFDFLCCGAILLPVVWSIRHLQEASQTDGKAAMNLRKLKLFRHFYIMVVCYIYFTRIIVYLLKITVPFQYEWLNVMFFEMATYVFFVMTGYKFRPATSNPYFRVTEEDEDMDEVLTKTGLTESVTRVNQHGKEPSLDVMEKEICEDDEEVNLLNTQESSHDFD